MENVVKTNVGDGGRSYSSLALELASGGPSEPGRSSLLT